MPDLHHTVIAGSVAAADGLLGLLPEATPADVLLLGLTATDVAADVAALPATTVRCLPAVDPSAEPGVLGPVLRDLLPAHGVVVLDSDQTSRDLAGWLAITLDAPLLWAIDAIRPARGGLAVQADRIVLGGGHRMVHTVDVDGPVLVMGKPGVPASGQDRIATAPPALVEDDRTPGDARVLVTRADDDGPGTVPLAGARLVVSVGRGICGPEHLATYAALAERLGAALGASRVAVDAGWAPFACQVGQTGTSVVPEVYLAFGISGAIQHLAGMRGSRRVVAINTDHEAPLCRHADLVVHGDANTVARALLQRLG